MTIHIDVRVYLHSDEQERNAEHRHAEIIAHLNTMRNLIMATLQDLQASVAAENTVIDSAIALLNGLAAAVAALKPNQAAIDALAADIGAKTQALADAVVANTPATP
jgi:argininosuccinate lyase